MPTPDILTNGTSNETPVEQPVRELTQTDRLNNKLLKSFLEHMNERDHRNDDTSRTTYKHSGNEEDRAAEFEE